METAGLRDLAYQCEFLLDNPPAYDGFRPCNSAVYHAIFRSLDPGDLYIIRDVEFEDGISLRNTIWDAMCGDSDSMKSKMLMAMSYSEAVNDITYTFERHGVTKYFAKQTWCQGSSQFEIP